MITESRGRFGASRELEGSVSVRGEIRGWNPKSAKSVLDFGSWPGSGRVMSGSRSGRGRVGVESRSSRHLIVLTTYYLLCDGMGSSAAAPNLPVPLEGKASV